MPEPTSTATTAALAAASGLGAAVGVGMIDHAAMAVFGVPAIVVIFAFIGAAAAMAYSEPIRPWVRMVLLAAANTMLGIVAAVGLHYVPGFAWTEGVPSQAVSFAVAFVALWIAPILIGRLSAAARKRVDQVIDKEGEPHA